MNGRLAKKGEEIRTTSAGGVVAKIGLYNTDYPYLLEHEVEVPGRLPIGHFYVDVVLKGGVSDGN